MKSLRLSEAEEKDHSEHSILSNQPQYPYGMKICIDPGTFKKLEMTVPKVGQKFMVLAYAEVCEVRKIANEGDMAKYSVDLQLMEMDLKPKENENNMDRAEKIYG